MALAIEGSPNTTPPHPDEIVEGELVNLEPGVTPNQPPAANTNPFPGTASETAGFAPDYSADFTRARADVAEVKDAVNAGFTTLGETISSSGETTASKLDGLREAVSEGDEGTHTRLETLTKSVDASTAALDGLTTLLSPRARIQETPPSVPWGPGQAPTTIRATAQVAPRPPELAEIQDAAADAVFEKARAASQRAAEQQTTNRGVAAAREIEAKQVRLQAKPQRPAKPLPGILRVPAQALKIIVGRPTKYIWDRIQPGFLDSRGRTGPRNIVGRRRQGYPYN